MMTTVIHTMEFRPGGGPPQEHDRTVETLVPGASEVTELAVIAEGLVVPKEISRYDDQGQLLMQAEFLSYEIEYDDGTAVYAEPE